jgi:hypothetical protein
MVVKERERERERESKGREKGITAMIQNANDMAIITAGAVG